MEDQGLLEDRKAKCLLCLDSGIVELFSGEVRKCPRGCEQPADFLHPWPEILKAGGPKT